MFFCRDVAHADPVDNRAYQKHIYQNNSGLPLEIILSFRAGISGILNLYIEPSIPPFE
jgi:hypothetical protein